MYMKTQAERVVRIPPARLNEDIENVIGKLTCESFEGQFGNDKDLCVLIQNVEPKGDGRIVHGDGGVYQTVKYDQIVFKFKDNEVIEGQVVEVTKFGAFVNFGPLDGLIHISQVMEDHVEIDIDNQRLIGKESGKTLSKDDRVRARIISSNIDETNPQGSRIGLTMRQPGLGRLEWIAEDQKKRGEA